MNGAHETMAWATFDHMECARETGGCEREPRLPICTHCDIWAHVQMSVDVSVVLVVEAELAA